MRYFDAIRSKSCPAFLPDHETQHKTFNQRKNAIALANKYVWIHHNLFQFLPYHMLYALVIGFPEGWDPGLIWGL